MRGCGRERGARAPDAAAAARRNRASGGMSTMPEVASIMLGFLPLNHLMGRMGILQCLGAGGYTTFVRARAPARPRARAGVAGV